MNQAAAPNQNLFPDLVLVVSSGADKGVQYKIMGQLIKVGRAPENHIIIKDDIKVSRYHAQIELTPKGYTVKDLKSSHGVLVNGKKISVASLQLGDQIVFGSTKMILQDASTEIRSIASGGAALPSLKDPTPLKQNSGGPITSKDRLDRMARPPTSKPNSISPVILLIAALLIGGAAYFATAPQSGTKKSGFQFKDSATLNEQLSTSMQDNERLEAEIRSAGKDSQLYSEAQGFFLRGFRDYREQNYSRAIQNFEAALALYSSHPTARVYLEKTRLKLNQIVTEALARGEKDFSLQKYQKALNEYNTVINLVNNPDDPNVRLARKRKEAIELIMLKSR